MTVQAGPGDVNPTAQSHVTSLGSIQRAPDPLLPTGPRLQAIRMDIRSQVSTQIYASLPHREQSIDFCAASPKSPSPTSTSTPTSPPSSTAP